MFQKLISTPLSQIVCAAQITSGPLAGGHGIVKGSVMVEVLAYRDVARPLPSRKEVETANEEDPQAHSAAAAGGTNYHQHRTLKLRVTDGVNEFACMEYEPCSPALDLVRLGAKLQLKDVYYANGMLLLTPRSVQFVGAPSSLENWQHLLLQAPPPPPPPPASTDVIELV